MKVFKVTSEIVVILYTVYIMIPNIGRIIGPLFDYRKVNIRYLLYRIIS